MNDAATHPCPQCGWRIAPGAVSCARCGALLYRERLEQLAAQAAAAERTDPRSAASFWQQCLPLLPSDSAQYHTIVARLARLNPPRPAPPSHSAPAQTSKSPTLAGSVTITLVSMFISALVYAQIADWWFSVGLMLSILVHELGHSLACLQQGLRATPPIFIPLLGAFIGLKDKPRDVAIEAYVGIAGPIFGLIAGLACWMWFQSSGSVLALRLAEFGFFINLANLLPFRPLDGGRVVAAVVPLVARNSPYWQQPYYRIPGRVAALIGLAYALLAAVLIALFMLARRAGAAFG